MESSKPFVPYHTNKPEDQVYCFKKFMNIINDIMSNDSRVLIGGDLNLDLNLMNDPYNRQDIRDTLPLLDEIIDDHSFTQLNNNNTRFRAGQRPSLLDLFVSNCPDHIKNVGTFVNLASEHLGVECAFSNSKTDIKPQFKNIRS